MLDTKTLIMTIAALTMLAPLLYYLLHKSGSMVGGTLQWTLASVFSAIGLCLMMFRDIAPDYLVIVGAGTAFALAYGIGWSGMRIFVGRRPARLTVWLIVLLQIPPTLWFTLVRPSQIASSTLIALVIAVFCILIARDLFKGALALRRPMRVYGAIVYLLQALAMAIRVILIQALSQDGSGPSWEFINEATFFWNIIFVFSLLASVLLMVSEKLQAEIKTLRGIVPICAQCKKVRDDSGYWQQVESYVTNHSEAQFSHGLCPDCFEKAMAEIQQIKANKQ